MKNYEFKGVMLGDEDEAPPAPPPAPEQKKETPRDLLWLASYIVLLVLAPLMHMGIEYEIGGNPFVLSAYYPLLGIAVPLLAAAYFLRPTHPLFFIAAPLLPVEMYFSLQGSAAHSWLLVLVVLSMLGLPLYHVLKTSRPQETPETASHGRAYWRRALTFGVGFMAAVLLVTAGLGAFLPERHAPVEAETPLTQEMAPANMELVLIELSKPWPESMEERDKILQALLEQECASQPAGTVYLIGDPVIKAITTVEGRRAAAMARRTKEEELEKRVELICYIAKVQKLRLQELRSQPEADESGKLPRITNKMRSDAKYYAEGRVPYYVDQVRVEG